MRFVCVFVVPILLILAAAASGCAKRSLLPGSGRPVDQTVSLDAGAAKITASASRIEKSAVSLAKIEEAPPPVSDAIASHLEVVTGEVSVLRETSKEVSMASSAVKTDQKACLEIKKENASLKDKVTELKDAVNSSLRRWLVGIGIACAVLTGVFLYLRSFWLAGLTVSMFGGVAVAIEILRWRFEIMIGLFVLGAVVLAWKLLIDDTVLKRVLGSVKSTLLDRVEPKIADEMKEQLRKAQGPAVSELVKKKLSTLKPAK